MTPTVDDVTTALADLGGVATAKALCDSLVARGFDLSRAQLGIQRSTDGERVVIDSDWQLRLAA